MLIAQAFVKYIVHGGADAPANKAPPSKGKGKAALV